MCGGQILAQRNINMQVYKKISCDYKEETRTNMRYMSLERSISFTLEMDSYQPASTYEVDQKQKLGSAIESAQFVTILVAFDLCKYCMRDILVYESL